MLTIDFPTPALNSKGYLSNAAIVQGMWEGQGVGSMSGESCT